MKNAFIMLGIILALLVGGQVFLSYKQAQNQADSLYSSLGGDFNLQGVSGEEISLKKFQGKNLIMYLGFTHCPDICPTAMTTLEKVLEKLSPKHRKQIQALFVSVDYQRDTPQVVDDYIKYYIDELVRKYAAYYKFNNDKDSGLDYSVDHTSRFYIISKKGVLVDSVADTETIETIVNKINKISGE